MSTLDPKLVALIPREVRALAATLGQHQKRSWIVGGCVRDLLLGRAVTDWDLATDALPKEVVGIFRRSIPTGIAHGTVTVLLKDSQGKEQAFEVTTLRGETTYSDGRHPDAVHFVDDIVRDLARRDFTVNAIAVDPNTMEIIDPFDGQKDLKRKVLRAVGNAHERFSEDGLRVLRAARFVATLELELESETRAAIAPTLDTFRKVSAERVRDEWVKTMKAQRPSRAFEVMRETGILGVSCPELMEGVGLEQNKWHEFDVWGHAMACLDACVGDPILRIGALLHDVGKPRSREYSEKTKDYTFYDHDRIGAEIANPICLRLKFSNDDRARIVHLVRHHLFHYTDEWTDAAVRRWVRRVGVERLEDLYALNEADVLGKGNTRKPDDLAPLAAMKVHVAKILAEGSALTVKALKVNGSDLMSALGRPPGRWLGIVLEQLLEEVLAEPALNDRDVLLLRAKDLVVKDGA